MNSYFVAVGSDRRGPFTMNELETKAVPLLPDTLVWHRGMAEWTTASSVAELRPMIGTVQAGPPPIAPASGGPAIPPSDTMPVARWIVAYAVLVSPALWVLQRFANLIELASLQDKPQFNAMVLVCLCWAFATFITAGLVFLGGKQASERSQRRAWMLRIGLGLSIGLSCLMVLAAVFQLGIASATPATGEANTGGGFGDRVAGIAAFVWLASFVTECIAWLKLGNPASR